MLLWSVSLARPQRRAVDVTLELTTRGEASVELSFPVWTPGSYLVRDHQRHIHDFAATTADGRPLAWSKTTRNAYVVDTTGVDSIRVRYEVYGFELTVRTNHIDDTHAFLNPVAVFPLVRGREWEAQRVDLTDLPARWEVAAGLPVSVVGPTTRRIDVPDHDTLADTPLEIGPHARTEAMDVFEVDGIRHEIVYWGEPELDRPRFARDVEAIVRAQGAMFGGLPYERYVFIVQASDAGRGGLEHRASTALLIPRTGARKPAGYEDLLGLVSHELFHAWNVKRIKPAAFTPYDLDREAPTRLLWAFEGLTSYYEDIILVRAGLMSPDRYVEALAERFTALERVGGRKRLSVTDASFDAWIRLYRPDENLDDASPSYYLKGSLVGVLLDLHIRERTSGARSLDDVMRLLWSRNGQTGVGVPEDGVEQACAEVAGVDLSAFFDLCLRSTQELPTAEVLRTVGLTAVRRVSTGPDDKGGRTVPDKAALRSTSGLVVRAEGDRVRVAQVRRGSAAEVAGIAPGDELVAVDGRRAASETVARWTEQAPGTSVHCLLFRRELLIERTLVLAEAVADTWTIDRAADATPDEQSRRQAWIGG